MYPKHKYPNIEYKMKMDCKTDIGTHILLFTYFLKS